MLWGLNRFGFGQVLFREGHGPGKMLMIGSSRVEYSSLFPQRVAKFYGVRQQQETHRAEEALGVWRKDAWIVCFLLVRSDQLLFGAEVSLTGAAQGRRGAAPDC